MNNFNFKEIQSDLQNCEKMLGKENANSKIAYPTKKRKKFKYKSKKDIRKEVLQSKAKECTFKPKINRNIKPKSTSGKKDVVDRLYARKKLYHEEAERKRKEREEEILEMSCPFIPNSELKDASSRGKKKISSNFFHYLHHSNDNRKLYLDQLQKEKSEREMSQCSFTPHIGLSSQYSLYYGKNARKKNETSSVYIDPELPIHKRYAALQKRKEEEIQRRKEEYFRSLNLKFRPEINTKSKKIHKMIKQGGVQKKRMDEYMKRKRMMKHEEYLNALHPFNPQINRNTDQIMNRNPEYFRRGFMDRQNVYLEERKKKGEFNETVSKLRGRDQKKKKLRKDEKDQKEMFYRLSVKDQQTKVNHLKILEHKYFGNTKFQPKLNDRFNEKVKGTDFQELVNNERKSIKLDLLKRGKFKDVYKEHSFKPKLVAGAVKGSKKYRLFTKDTKDITRRIEERKRKKQVSLMEKKREYEERKVEGCTFQPNLNKSQLSFIEGEEVEPMYINGYHEFLAKCDHAKNIEDDKKRRVYEVFDKWGTQKKLKKGKGKNFTIPKPFDLHQNNDYNCYEIQKLARMKEDKYETANCKYLFNV